MQLNLFLTNEFHKPFLLLIFLSECQLGDDKLKLDDCFELNKEGSSALPINFVHHSDAVIKHINFVIFFIDPSCNTTFNKLLGVVFM